MTDQYGNSRVSQVAKIMLRQDRSRATRIRQRQREGAEMTNRLRRERRERQKAQMVDALKQSLGNITAASLATGIDRTTFYLYKREDPDFALAIEQAKEGLADYAQYKLIQLVEQNHFPSIRLLLAETRKDREASQMSNEEESGSNLIHLREHVSDEDVISILERVQAERVRASGRG